MDVYYSICWAFEMFCDFSTSFKKKCIDEESNWPVFKSLTLPPGVWLWANYLISLAFVCCLRWRK